MNLYLVVWTAWACPGWIFGRLVPQSIHPLVCEAKKEALIYPSRIVAVDKVRRLGAGAAPALWEQNHLELKSIKLTWRTELEIEEKQ